MAPPPPQLARRLSSGGNPRPEIKKISPLHEALMNHLLVYPKASNRELAKTFNRTQAWISTIIHSHAFQAKLAERQDKLFEQAVITTREKLEGVADAAVEKLGEQLETSADPKFILDVADRTLHRLGYAPSRAPAPQPTTVNQQVNLFGQVDAQTLARARERIGATVPVLEQKSDAETPD
jgi:hypothetical protein